MQKKLLFIFVFVVVCSIFAFFSVFSLERVYDYAQFEQKINTISLTNGTPISLTLSDEADSLVLAFPKSMSSHPDQIVVRWNIDGKMYTRQLDIEDTDITDNWYTFPLIIPPRTQVGVEVFGYSGDEVNLIATNSSRTHFRLTLGSKTVVAEDVLRIVSRAEWGADESLRYVSSSVVAKNITEWIARGKTPKVVTISQATQASNDKDTQIGKRFTELHPESFQVQAKIRYENGKKLIWPINRAHRIDRIILHHTSETVSQANMDDLAVMRAIYAYHARTRGWGDIGYNYVVGRDGTIYEGRIGGAYVQGAHTLNNNLGTVGVSVIGNFEQNTLPAEQRVGLERILVSLAKQYGINVLEDTVGFRECPKNSKNCLIDERTVKRLHGHRDTGYTDCPGKNLYVLMDELRKKVASEVGNIRPIDNPEPFSIEAVHPEDIVKYVVANESATPTSKPAVHGVIGRVNPTLGGKNIRIRLSYPQQNSIALSAATSGIRDVRLDGKKIPTSINKNIKVGIVGNNKLIITAGNMTLTGSEFSYKNTIVRIDSWSRVPSWDTTGKYNDNLFRGTIILRNQDGNLIVINELPIEDYLRGLGEVSNSDPIEKIKTIIVAARSYALYYRDPMNRKYNTSLYDGSDNPDEFQKYLGYGYEQRSPIVSDLVRATRGEVVTFSGNLVKVWYFSSSDGVTRSYLQYCQSLGRSNCEDIPYLQSVEDPGGVGKTRSGHGVGISGVGATYFAKQGWDYKKIIQYYLQGVEILKK